MGTVLHAAGAGTRGPVADLELATLEHELGAKVAAAQHIDATWQEQDVTTLCAMAGALMGIGKRNKELNAAALRVGRAIGPIHFDDKCDPMEVEKHLASDWLKKKLGIA